MLRDSLNITAHSGSDGTVQDTLESVLAGQRLGADAVELDVRVNARGEALLSHDEDPALMYPGKALLAEAFGIVAGDAALCVNCDVKEAEAVPPILRLAREQGIPAERLILTGSLRPSMLEQDPGIVKNARVWLNIEEIIEDYYRTGAPVMEAYRHLVYPQSHRHDILRALAGHFDAFADPMIADCRRLGVRAINMPLTEDTRSLIPHILSKGMQASIWTINDEKKLKELFALGVINVTTRNVALAVQVRNSVEPVSKSG